MSVLSVVCQYLYNKSQCQRCLLYASTCTRSHNVSVVCCMPVPVQQITTSVLSVVCQYLYAKRAEEIVSSHNKSQPLFLYLPFQSVHAPLEVLSELCYRFLGLLYIENRSNYIISFINSDTALFSCFFSSSSLALLSMTLVRHFFESKRKENTWWNYVIRRLAVTRCIRRKHTCQ